MKKSLRLVLAPEAAFDEQLYDHAVRKAIGLSLGVPLNIQTQKRSIDARGRSIKVLLELDAYINEAAPSRLSYPFAYQNVANRPPVVIVGCGPAGMFAALRLLELGLKPIIIERGKDVQSRRRDLAAINRRHIVNPDSNYCFGEGGAGTYSDGKLYTRATKRGDVRMVLETMVLHGAREEILIDTHPHIGTNKLPSLVAAWRDTILSHGGEVHFNTRVEDFILENNEIRGVITQQGASVEGLGVILATGHSARNIFQLLHQRNILIEEKPFAMGLRVEHPQELIDKIQYHGIPRGQYLPPAAYSLVCQTMFQGKQRGAFSFCMCPGGFIVAAATAPGEVVVNGMSPSKRDNQFANSGIVVSIEKEDLQAFRQYGPLAGLQMQMELEQMACQSAGGTQTAPAQLLADFAEGRPSTHTLDTSYIPGLAPVALHEMLPANMSSRLQQAFKTFGQKMKGYLTNDAQVVGVESRTSSPVRIPRDKDLLEHLQVNRLYPCAEGAGYAGGIVSAAIDGVRCAEMLFEKYGKNQL